LIVVVAAIALVANLPKSSPASASAATETPSAEIATPTPTEDLGNPVPTPEPPNGPVAAKLGQVIDITCDSEDCMRVSVVKVAFASRYRDPQGYYDDVPDSGYI